MSAKPRVVVLFGGRSSEHEVSILSARNVWRALTAAGFTTSLVGVDRDGRFRHEPSSTLEAAAGDPRALRLHGDGPELFVPTRPGPAPAGMTAAWDDTDVVFPVLHGTYGEDGTLQGLLELAGVAYVGCGPLGAAVGMDKDVTKRLLAQAGIPVVPWVTVPALRWALEPDAVRAEVADLGLPCFVKPANAGSSVGVVKVRHAEELGAAFAEAFRYDTRVLVERGVDAREVECAVLGNEEPQASQPGEITVHHKDGFYSYAAKYVDADGADWRIPADLPPDGLDDIRVLSTLAFEVLQLQGLARVDFFVERGTGRTWLNEVNTLPGFTAISMYPKMWEASGLPVEALVTRLVDLAVQRHTTRRALEVTC